MRKLLVFVAAAMAVVDSLKFLLERFGLGGVLALRDLADGCLQITQHFHHASAVLAMKGSQFVQDVVSPLDARMAEYLPAGHHLKGDATEAQADLDA